MKKSAIVYVVCIAATTIGGIIYDHYRKKKLEEVLSLVVVAIIGLAIVVWVGFSVYTKIQQSAAENATYKYYDIDTAAIQDYLSTLD